MPNRTNLTVEEIRDRLLAQLESHGDSAIVPIKDLTAWVVRCTDYRLGSVYRWTIVGLEETPRADTPERFAACDQAARALLAAVMRSTENAA